MKPEERKSPVEPMKWRVEAQAEARKSMAKPAQQETKVQPEV